MSQLFTDMYMYVLIYDTCFRRRAALTKSLEWEQVDFSLYNETFTGRARPICRCTRCSSEHHIEMECPEASQTHLPLDNHRGQAADKISYYYQPYLPVV